MVIRHRTVHDLRHGNRATVLRTLYFDGPASRQDLTILTGLSAGTLSNVTGELLGEGILIPDGTIDSTGGRPKVMLKVDPSHRQVIGVDVGETAVVIELFDLGLNRQARVEHGLPSGRLDIDIVVDRIVSGIDAVIAEAKVSPHRLLGVGIGVPGIVEQQWQPLVHAPTIGWDAVPLAAEIHRATSLPLFLDNGAKTLGRAELWFGGGRSVRHAIVALVGSGVGAAIIADGETYRGATSSAGEWGHTTMAVDGRVCRCGARGCLESYVGAVGILSRYRELVPAAAESGDGHADLAKLLADADDGGAAAEVVGEAIAYLGVGLGNLINLFNPQRIILGGWAGLLLGERSMPAIRAATAGHALAHPYHQADIVLGTLGADAVALGAATLVVDDFLDSSLRAGRT